MFLAGSSSCERSQLDAIQSAARLLLMVPQRRDLNR
jgi:hypothetical protein